MSLGSLTWRSCTRQRPRGAGSMLHRAG
jgi:hypothetical protein